MSAPNDHPSTATLLDYWLHDSDAATTELVDEHLMRCDACGEALDELMALGDGVRAAVRAGAVAAVATSAFVQRLRDRGVRVRSYRLPHNGSVDCTVAPGDEVLVAHLEVPLAGVERIDLVTEMSTGPERQQRLQDIPFDPRSGEVVCLAKIAEVREFPAHTMTIELLAVAPGGASQELGRYRLFHQPWRGD